MSMKEGDPLELNKKTIRNILLVIAAAVLMWWLVNHFPTLTNFFTSVVHILSPVLVGLVLAFIMNLLLNPLERLWRKLFDGKNSTLANKLRRPMCLLLSFIIVLGVIFAVCFVVIPRLSSTVVEMVNTISAYFKTLDVQYDSLRASLEKYAITLPEIDLGKSDLFTKVTDLLAKGGTALLNTTLNITTSVLSAVVNLLMGVVFCIYILAQKETLSRQLKKLLYVTFSPAKVDTFLAFLGRVSRTFSQFVTGQTIEAVILGALVFVGMLIFRLPYAPVIAVLVGVTALIPILGSWIGAIVGALLILPVSFMQAIWFVVFLIILQQIEGNLIYPHVVGKSVGLPGIWVFFAVIVGSGLGGIAGMLLGVPVCAVIYDETRRNVRRKEAAMAAASGTSESAPDTAPEPPAAQTADSIPPDTGSETVPASDNTSARL